MQLIQLSLSSNLNINLTQHIHQQVSNTQHNFNQIYTIYSNFKANIYMKYILYTQISHIIFNDTFRYSFHKYFTNTQNFTLMPLLA